jgi:hypothetical protein
LDIILILNSPFALHLLKASGKPILTTSPATSAVSNFIKKWRASVFPEVGLRRDISPTFVIYPDKTIVAIIASNSSCFMN